MVKKSDFYSSTSSQSTELDLRTEFSNTMYGKGPEIAKSQAGLARIFRRISGELVPCPCVNNVTGEPDRESRCPICLGEGNLWDESDIDFYHMSAVRESLAQLDNSFRPGIINTVSETFYIPWQFNLTKEDKIVVLRLDKEGQKTTPLIRLQLFRVSQVRQMRLDNGRIEFWKLFAYEDSSKFL